METIIQRFVEKVISLKENSFESLNNINFLSDFTDNLNAELMQIGREITTEYINEIEELIYNSSERKEKYISYQKNTLANDRKLITVFGEIEFSRRYYQDRDNTKIKKYLLDKAIGISEKERMLVNVEENMLELASVKSYEYAGQKAAYDTVISKETVMNKVSKLNFDNIQSEVYEKQKDILNLYIQADEDHVHLQKGGIAMPRIIAVYEQNDNGKLINKKCFGGMYYKNVESLWESILTYIDNKYDLIKINKIFIAGDGASWIKTGLEIIPKSIYISDNFHIYKAIIALACNDKKHIKMIKDAMFGWDFDEVENVGEYIISKQENLNKAEKQKQMLEYILNNEEGFKNAIRYNVTCSAEGDVSHIFADRLSSRPLRLE